VKTNPGKVISKGMIDISGHPNIAAAGGGKTRIYKSAGKELSNRFFKGCFKVPTSAYIHGRVTDLSFILHQDLELMIKMQKSYTYCKVARQ
jgi:hypothetical protein